MSLSVLKNLSNYFRRISLGIYKFMDTLPPNNQQLNSILTENVEVVKRSCCFWNIHKRLKIETFLSFRILINFLFQLCYENRKVHFSCHGKLKLQGTENEPFMTSRFFIVVTSFELSKSLHQFGRPSVWLTSYSGEILII